MDEVPAASLVKAPERVGVRVALRSSFCSISWPKSSVVAFSSVRGAAPSVRVVTVSSDPDSPLLCVASSSFSDPGSGPGEPRPALRDASPLGGLSLKGEVFEAVVALKATGGRSGAPLRERRAAIRAPASCVSCFAVGPNLAPTTAKARRSSIRCPAREA